MFPDGGVLGFRLRLRSFSPIALLTPRNVCVVTEIKSNIPVTKPSNSTRSIDLTRVFDVEAFVDSLFVSEEFKFRE